MSLVALGEPGYPWRLQMIDDPPPLIAVRGQLPVLDRPMFAVVGARNASAAGIKLAGRLARELGEAGLVVVSGLARGIDAAAHRATLATGTVAVLAGGHNRIYPPENQELAGALLAQGASLSEMPLDWEPRAHDFPRRNRLISGLAVGVRGDRGGAPLGLAHHHAARARAGPRGLRGAGLPARSARGRLQQPLEAGRHAGHRGRGRARGAAADPGSAAGAIDAGAAAHRAVTAPARAPARAPDRSADERTRIVQLLGPTPVGIDDLVRLAGRSPAVVRIVLLELEVAGRLQRHGGGLVSLV